jgi:hypothetical protein
MALMKLHAVLATVALGQLDARDLGDGVRLVGLLQEAAEQALFLQRLGGHLRVDARGTQEEQLLHPVL